MYIAMNRFKVRPEEQEAFKARWFDREVYLKTVPGFVPSICCRAPTARITSSMPPIQSGVRVLTLRTGPGRSNFGPRTPVPGRAARSP